VLLAALDPVVGREIAKTRPVLVVSNDLNNRHAGTVTLLPITSSTARVYPFEVFLPAGTANLPKDSKVKADQIRTVDRSRLVKTIGSVDAASMAAVDQALRLHLSL
jgi:mRNA interferase MazF